LVAAAAGDAKSHAASAKLGAACLKQLHNKSVHNFKITKNTSPGL